MEQTIWKQFLVAIPVIVVSDTPQTSQPCSISRLTSDKGAVSDAEDSAL